MRAASASTTRPAQTLIHGERVIEPVPGANLVLTIDAELQRLAEKSVAHVAAAAVVDRRAQDRQDAARWSASRRSIRT